MKLYFVLIFFVSLQASAQGREQLVRDFCKEYTSSSELNFKKKNYSSFLSWTLRGLVAPESLVQISELQNSDKLFVDKNSETSSQQVVFSTLEKAEMTPAEIISAKSVRKEIFKYKKRFLESSLYQELKKTQRYDDCIDLVGEKENEFESLRELRRIYEHNHNLLEHYTKFITYETFLKRIIFLKKRGWRIIEEVSFQDIHKHLQYEVRNAVIVSHATRQGQLIDRYGEVFPQGFFRSFPKSLKNLVVYSCYSEEVIKNYQLSNFQGGYRYYYPQIVSNPLLGSNSTPILSLKSLKKVLGNFSQVKDIPFRKECSVSVESRQSLSGAYFYLNDSFVGAFKFDPIRNMWTHPFDCSILKEGNNFFDMYIDNLKVSLEKFEVQLNLNDQIESLDMKNFFSPSSGKLIVSKSTFFLTKPFELVLVPE
jgi:hypothetical protein